MKVQRIFPMALLAAALCFGCNTPKSDGTAKHDTSPGTGAAPTAGGTSGGTSGGSASGTAGGSAPTTTTPSPAVIHVADVMGVEGSLGSAKVAPNFTWKGVDGQEHSLKEYSGKVVMLNFWGTWCPPCRAELPDIVKLRNELQSQGFEVIGLGLGEQARGGMTPAERVADFARTNGLNYPLLLASEELANAYGGIEAVPTTFILNGKGEVVEKMVGMQREQAFRDAIKKAM